MPRSPGFYLILTVGLFAACGTDTPAVPASDTASAASVDAEVEWFVDRTEATGLDYIHFNGMTGGFYTPEMMGPGVGLFDYDNDGDLDVYIPQGELLGEGEPLITPPEGQPPTVPERARSASRRDADAAVYRRNQRKWAAFAGLRYWRGYG